MKTRTASGQACTMHLKVRMRMDDAWAECRLEVLGGELVVEESSTTATGAVVRAAGVLVDRLRDRGYEPRFEVILGAIEQSLAASLVRSQVGASS